MLGGSLLNDWKQEVRQNKVAEVVSSELDLDALG